jgi:hypothetical protein
MGQRGWAAGSFSWVLTFDQTVSLRTVSRNSCPFQVIEAGSAMWLMEQGELVTANEVTSQGDSGHAGTRSL